MQENFDKREKRADPESEFFVCAFVRTCVRRACACACGISNIGVAIVWPHGGDKTHANQQPSGLPEETIVPAAAAAAASVAMPGQQPVYMMPYGYNYGAPGNFGQVCYRGSWSSSSSSLPMRRMNDGC